MDNRTEILLDNIGMTYKTTDGRDVTALTSVSLDIKKGEFNPNTVKAFVSASMKGWAYACEHTEEAAEIVFAAGSSVSAAHQSYMAGEVAKLVTTDMNGNAVSAANVGNMDETAMQQTLDLAKKYIILEDSAAKEKLASMTLDDIRSTAYLTYDKEKDGAPEKTSVSVQLKWLPQAQFMGYYVAKQGHGLLGQKARRLCKAVLRGAWRQASVHTLGRRSRCAVCRIYAPRNDDFRSEQGRSFSLRARIFERRALHRGRKRYAERCSQSGRGLT